MKPERCADCGARIEWVSVAGQWGRKMAPGHWSFTCRMSFDGDRLKWADYHHLDGEAQRQFRAVE